MCIYSRRLDAAKKLDVIMVPWAVCSVSTISRQIDYVETALILQRCEISVDHRLIAAAVNTECHRIFIVTAPGIEESIYTGWLRKELLMPVMLRGYGRFFCYPKASAFY
jgi:hypothetical protein